MSRERMEACVKSDGLLGILVVCAKTECLGFPRLPGEIREKDNEELQKKSSRQRYDRACHRDPTRFRLGSALGQSRRILLHRMRKVSYDLRLLLAERQ